MVTAIFIILLSFSISGLIGYLLGEPRGKAAAGFWLGALLGPLGWVLVLLLTIADGQRAQPAAIDPPRPVRLVRQPAPLPERKPGPRFAPEALINPRTKTAEGRWLYLGADGTAGPLGRSQILALAADGTIPRNTPVMHEGDTKWRTVADLEF